MAYRGVVPPEAITRYAQFDYKQQGALVGIALNPTITTENYELLGRKYRELTAWLFGDRSLMYSDFMILPGHTVDNEAVAIMQGYAVARSLGIKTPPKAREAEMAKATAMQYFKGRKAELKKASANREGIVVVNMREGRTLQRRDENIGSRVVGGRKCQKKRMRR